MIAHTHPYAFMAVYLGIWALFILGLVLGARRASRREES